MKNLLYLHEDEKNRILNLHKKLISEQTVDAKPLTDAAATPVNTTTQTGQPVQQPNKIVTLQGILNNKFGGNLVPDGKWGPKTAAAVQKALATLQTQTAVNNPTTTTTTTIATGTATTGTATTGTATTGTATTGTETTGTETTGVVANPKQDMDDQPQQYWGKNGPIQQ